MKTTIVNQDKTCKTQNHKPDKLKEVIINNKGAIKPIVIMLNISQIFLSVFWLAPFFISLKSLTYSRIASGKDIIVAITDTITSMSQKFDWLILLLFFLTLITYYLSYIFTKYYNSDN